MDHSIKTYQRQSVCHFSKADEPWGEFGNMTGDFGFRLLTPPHDQIIPSVENLYQAMRFTEHPDIQREVIKQKQGFGAKLKAKKYRKTHTRADFEDLKVEIMYWCLKLKLANHPIRFGGALQRTGDRPIVEESTKDPFWGAKSDDDDQLVGANILGQLLMDLREYYLACINAGNEDYKFVIPPVIEGFTLFGREIPVIDRRSKPKTP